MLETVLNKKAIRMQQPRLISRALPPVLRPPCNSCRYAVHSVPSAPDDKPGLIDGFSRRTQDKALRKEERCSKALHFNLVFYLPLQK